MTGLRRERRGHGVGRRGQSHGGGWCDNTGNHRARSGKRPERGSSRKGPSHAAYSSPLAPHGCWRHGAIRDQRRGPGSAPSDAGHEGGRRRPRADRTCSIRRRSLRRCAGQSSKDRSLCPCALARLPAPPREWRGTIASSPPSRCAASRNWLLGIARARTARQQSSGELTSGATTTRAKCARLQISEIGSAPCFRPCGRIPKKTSKGIADESS